MDLGIQYARLKRFRLSEYFARFGKGISKLLSRADTGQTKQSRTAHTKHEGYGPLLSGPDEDHMDWEPTGPAKILRLGGQTEEEPKVKRETKFRQNIKHPRER